MTLAIARLRERFLTRRLPCRRLYHGACHAAAPCQASDAPPISTTSTILTFSTTVAKVTHMPAQNVEEQHSLMQVREAARSLGVHENTLRRWEEAGRIRAVKLPTGVRRFRPEDVTRLRNEMFAGFRLEEIEEASRLGAQVVSR